MSYQKRILFVTNHPMQDGSNRYRIYQFLKAFEAAGFECTVRPFTTPDLFRKIRARRIGIIGLLQFAYCCLRRLKCLWDADDYELTVIHREAFPFFTPLIERLFLWRQPNVVFSFDDAIFHRSSARVGRFFPRKYGSGVDEVISRSSHILAGNEYLPAYGARLNS